MASEDQRAGNHVFQMLEERAQDEGVPGAALVVVERLVKSGKALLQRLQRDSGEHKMLQVMAIARAIARCGSGLSGRRTVGACFAATDRLKKLRRPWIHALLHIKFHVSQRLKVSQTISRGLEEVSRLLTSDRT